MTGYLIQLIISLAAYVILGPIFLLVALANELVRVIVSIYLLKKFNRNITLVSDGADAVWTLKRKERSRMVVIGIKLEKAVTIEAVRNCVRDKVLKARDENEMEIYSKFKWILVTKLGYACWKRDEKFNPNHHVRSLSSTKVYSKKDISKEFSLISQDMNEEKPQWELIIVPRFVDTGESESSLVLFRFQHAYADGFSLVMLLKNQMSTGFNYIIDPQELRIPLWKKILFYTNAVLVGPYTFLVVSVNKFRTFWPQLPKNGPTQKNYEWSKSLDLKTLQKLRKGLHSASIQIILENAFISAAKEVLPTDRLPNSWYICELAALLPYPKKQLQNRFAPFIYQINSQLTDFERIRVTKSESWNAMTSPWIPLTFLMFKAFGRLPVAAHGVLWAGGSCSMVFSYVPLSKTKFKFLGTTEMVDLVCFPPIPTDVGLLLSGFAYENTVKISAYADSTWLKEDELQKIIERIPNVLQEWVKMVELIEH